MRNITQNLPQFAYTAQQVKSNEALIAQSMGIEMYTLMKSAAESVFSLLQSKYADCKRVQILAGGGNNGGDGYWVANFAHLAGFTVSVYAIKPVQGLTGDAKRAYQDYIAVGGQVVDKLDTSAELYIDAILGIGFTPPLKHDLATFIDTINQQNKPIIAVDLPSGVDATSGELAESCIKASDTITFIALKQGLLTGSAQTVIGQLYFAGLNLAEPFMQMVTPNTKRITGEANSLTLPPREKDSYKQKLGHVVLIGGEQSMPGAIRIAAEACLRAGAGLVTVATHPDNRGIVIQNRYELMVHGIEKPTQLEALLEKADVCVIGPGLGQTSWSEMLWQGLKQIQCPVVLDADGLNWMSRELIPFNQLVITPHAGEAARLLNCSASQIELNRFLSVSKLAQLYHCCAVLKGPGTLVCEGTEIKINSSGNESMASAGMGDCLSGIIAAFIAQGMSIFEASQYGVYIHGKAAENACVNGMRGLLVSDLYCEIRALVG